MTGHQFTDRAPISGARRSAAGYLISVVRAARTGVQIYTGSEVGRPHMAQVQVLRPASAVFAVDSLRTLAHAPVTLGHPSQPVTAQNWSQLAVGEVSSSAGRDGDFVTVEITVKDSAAIRAVEAGTAELSLGYTCDLIPGPAGSGADFVQSNIRVDHLAIVDIARGGSELRIG